MASVYYGLKDSESSLLKQIVAVVNEKFMANIDFSDLSYISKVLKAL